jgi:hypothetical protein
MSVRVLNASSAVTATMRDPLARALMSVALFAQ